MHALIAGVVLVAQTAGAAAIFDASARLASLPGLRAELTARDEVLGRSFTARLVYRAPDRLLAVIAGDAQDGAADDYVLCEGGTITVREGGRTRRCDAGAWARASTARLAPLLREAAALAGSPAAGAALDDLRLAPLLTLDLRRGGDRIGIALLATHRLVGPEAPHGLAVSFGRDDEPPTISALDDERIVLRDGAREATISRATGFFERIVLRGPSGRIEGEVIASNVEVLASVPDAALAPPGGAGAGAGDVEDADPPPRTKESFARTALEALLGPLRKALEREPALAADGSPAASILERYYAALLAAAYREERLRDEARRATRADEASALAELQRAGTAGRESALERLRERFRANCAAQLKDAASELIRLAERAIGPEDGGALAEARAARRALVRLSGRAALAAFRTTIVAPMEAEAAAELARLASAPPSSGGNP